MTLRVTGVVPPDVTFTAEELALLKAALTVPTCWSPRVRDEALALVERAADQQLFLMEAEA